MGSFVNYLAKEELIYENIFRGVQVDKTKCSVESLRHSLRQNYNVVGNTRLLNGKIVLKEEFAVIESKLVTLKSIIENFDQDSPSDICRLRAKLNHIELRINNMYHANALSDVETSRLDKLKSDFKELKTQAKEVKCNKTEEEVIQFDDLLNKSLEEEETLHEKLQTGQHAKEVGPTPNSETVTGGLTDHRPKEPLNLQDSMPPTVLQQNQPSPIFNPSHELSNHTSTPLPIAYNPPTAHLNTNFNSTPFNSTLFNKLQNPVEKLLAQLTYSDGLEINSLLHFLNGLCKLRNQTNLSQNDLYEIIPAYTSGPLQQKLLECKNFNLSWDLVHKSIVSTFIPLTLLEILKRDFILRPQRIGEPLSVFIEDIKLHAQILQSDYTELQLVNLIKDAIEPNCRNKLNFESNPVTFKDLENITINTNNRMYLDHLREVNALQPNQCMSISTIGPNLRTNFMPAFSTGNRFYNSKPNTMPNAYGNYMYNPITNVNSTYLGNQRKPHKNRTQITCYNCQKVGHIARDCRTKPTPSGPKN